MCFLNNDNETTSHRPHRTQRRGALVRPVRWRVLFFERQDHLGDEEFKRLEAAAATRRLLLELREVWEWSQRFHGRALL